MQICEGKIGTADSELFRHGLRKVQLRIQIVRRCLQPLYRGTQVIESHRQMLPTSITSTEYSRSYSVPFKSGRIQVGVSSVSNAIRIEWIHFLVALFQVQ